MLKWSVEVLNVDMVMSTRASVCHGCCRDRGESHLLCRG